MLTPFSDSRPSDLDARRGGASLDFGEGDCPICWPGWCLGCPGFLPSLVTRLGWSATRFQASSASRSVTFPKGKRLRLGFRERGFRGAEPALSDNRLPPKLVAQRPPAPFHFGPLGSWCSGGAFGSRCPPPAARIGESASNLLASSACPWPASKRVSGPA